MAGFGLIAPNPTEFAALARLVEAFTDGPDEWGPEHYATAEEDARKLLPYVRRVERQERRAVDSGRAKAPKAPRAVRAREEGWWRLEDAKPVVHERSGGDCELRGDGCQGRARDVHHAFGRRGDDPHHPDKLLHLCGHGNQDGCHGLVHQKRAWRERAQMLCAALAARSAS